MPRIRETAESVDTSSIDIDGFGDLARSTDDVMSDVLDLTGASPYSMGMIEPIDMKGFYEFKERSEYEKFMEDHVTFQIHRSKDKNEGWAVFVSVNGEKHWIPRGVKVRMKRKFLERLVQSQERLFKTVDDMTGQDGQQYRVESWAAPSYPLAVLHDPSPMGDRWYNRMVASSC